MGLLDRLARMGLKPALDPNARQPVFYSALNEAIRTHPMEVATPEQWLAQIFEPERTVRSAVRDPATNKPMFSPDGNGEPLIEERVIPRSVKLPGVKMEEVKWSGIEDFLRGNTSSRGAPEKLTRDELYNYLDRASQTYAPDEFYMTSRGDYASEEDWLNDDAIRDQINEYQHEQISNDWFHYGGEYMPDVEIEPVGPRSSSEISEELAKARSRVEASLNKLNGFAQASPEDIAAVRSLEAEMEKALTREARDPLTPDMFTGLREIDIEPEPSGYRARIKGGYGDLDEALDDLFPGEDEAEEAAKDWIRDWRHEDGWYKFEEDQLNDSAYYDDAVEVVRENNPPNFGTEYHDYKLDGGKDYEELLLTLPGFEGEKAGTHWDEYVDDPVIAHVRFDTRTKDGKKILAVQEVQSDWHQQGRESGYTGQSGPEEIAQARAILESTEEQLRATQARQAEVVKSLPDDVLFNIFRHDSNSPELSAAMVRLLRTGEASGGFRQSYIQTNLDQTISWAARSPSAWGFVVDSSPDTIKILQTLKQENQALDLKRTEAKIAWDKAVGGTPDAPFKNNVWAAMAMKRMARKAADEGYDALAWSGKIKNGRVSSNQDGSEFYDKILVNEMNKLGKKSGVQVGSTYMNGFDWNSIEMTPEFREFLKKGLPLFMWPLFAGGAVSGGLLSRGQKRKTEA